MILEVPDRQTDGRTDIQADRKDRNSFFNLQDNESTFGLDNPGFDDSYSIREKPSKSGSPKLNQDENVIFPKSDERILLWQFEEPAERLIY